MMQIGIVGCGYVSSFYGATLPNYPTLKLAGVYDLELGHAESFQSRFGGKIYGSLEDLLSDDRVDIVANLTNPSCHYEVSRLALMAGKHVYSEKPLAMRLDHAAELVALAKEKGLQLSSAPCNVLSESAQTLWRAIESGMIGTPRLVYAELDDGMIHRLGYENWINEIGRPWPYKDEFEVGCTLEHAGYYVSWLVAFFGPVQRLTTYASCLIEDKQTRISVDQMAPDFSCACLEFATGIVARVTCGIVAPHDHRMRVFGDEGTLSVEDCWFYDAPVAFEPFSTMSVRMRKIPGLARWKGVAKRTLPMVPHSKTRHRYKTRGHRMDFARGIADLADAVKQGRDCRLSADFSLHVNEVVLCLQQPPDGLAQQTMTTSTGPMPMMHWLEKG